MSIHQDKNEVFFLIVKTIKRIALLLVAFAIFVLSAIFYIQVLVPQMQSLAFKKKQRELELAQFIEAEKNKPIQNGIHIRTGFIADDGLNIVISTCTACHSSKLVTQNSATKEGWTDMIRWMQETQNLWDLGDNEEIIVNYLSKNYGPKDIGRRKNLEKIEWYKLN